jgi:hypothetical protein
MLVILALATGASTAGCYSAEVGVAARAGPPDRIVWIAPGVWVVEGYPYPLFWYGDAYWIFYDGLWYRSSGAGAWIHVHVLPQPLIRIRTPTRYVRYRAPDGATVRNVRDHRRPPRRPPPERPAPRRR